MLTALKHWIILGLVITGISGLVYIAVQQDMRLSANDPQIELAENLASELQNGKSASELVSKDKVDLSKSLSSFVIIFNEKREVIASSANLNGKVPTLPSGVFDYTKANSEDRVTWQPQEGVRIATVVRYYNGKNSGYVLVGRSLREIEKRENWLTEQVGLTWLALMVSTFVVSLILNK